MIVARDDDYTEEIRHRGRLSYVRGLLCSWYSIATVVLLKVKD